MTEAVAEAASQFDNEAELFSPSLPSNISLDRFKAVVMWALNENPDLLRANRRSLMNACAKAANDGLLPDKKEGALVIYNVNEKRKVDGVWKDNWIKKVQWMPMVYGITKKALGSGAVLSLYAMVVFKEEVDQGKFTYRIIDGHHKVNHEPILIGDAGEPILAYAVAILASGVVEVQAMTLKDIARIQKVSKSKDSQGNAYGPWKDWWDEMWKKSAIRRLSKRIPFPPEVEQVIRRDDELIDFNQDDEEGSPAPLTQDVTAAAALMGGSGFPTGAVAESAPRPIEGEAQSEENETDEGDPAFAPPDEDAAHAELLERLKADGLQKAELGLPALKEWWCNLSEDVRTDLEPYKDSTLKPVAERAVKF